MSNEIDPVLSNYHQDPTPNDVIGDSDVMGEDAQSMVNKVEKTQIDGKDVEFQRQEALKELQRKEALKELNSWIAFVFLIIGALVSVKTICAADSAPGVKVAVIVFVLSVFYIVYQFTRSMISGGATRSRVIKVIVGSVISVISMLVAVFYPYLGYYLYDKHWDQKLKGIFS